MLRDAAMTGLMEGSGLDTQAYQPVAVYLNGDYWGMYNLREKINEHFVASKYDVDQDEVDLLEKDGEIIEGDNMEYQMMISYVEQNDLSVPDNYDFVANQMNINNFILYQVAQIYFNNRDWPGNNNKYFRASGIDWRWILFDTDFGFGIYNQDDYTSDTLAFALEANGPAWPNPPWSTLLLRKLMENDTFRNQFINYFADQLNSRFLTNNVSSLIQSLANGIVHEMPQHTDRWGSETIGGISWSEEINNMRTWGNNRPEFIRNHIQNRFGLSDSHTLTINNSTPTQGSVAINSLSIESASWNGEYFEGVPVNLTALPAEGFVFVGWSGASTSTNSAVQLSLSADATIQAIFELAP